MNWIFILLAVALFAAFIIFRVVLVIPLGVLNMLWMIALLFVVLWAVRWCA